jgi:hypothetical protein
MAVVDPELTVGGLTTLATCRNGVAVKSAGMAQIAGGCPGWGRITVAAPHESFD